MYTMQSISVTSVKFVPFNSGVTITQKQGAFPVYNPAELLVTSPVIFRTHCTPTFHTIYKHFGTFFSL